MSDGIKRAGFECEVVGQVELGMRGCPGGDCEHLQGVRVRRLSGGEGNVRPHKYLTLEWVVKYFFQTKVRISLT